MAFISKEDVRGSVPAELLDGRDDAALNIQIDAAEEIVRARLRELGKTLPEDSVPSLVKSVCMDVVRVLLTDITHRSESIGNGDYSYTQNTAALSQILARLSYLDNVEGGGTAGSAVKVLVV